MKKRKEKKRDFSHHYRYTGASLTPGVPTAGETSPVSVAAAPASQQSGEAPYLKRELIKVGLIMLFFAGLFAALQYALNETTLFSKLLENIKI